MTEIEKLKIAAQAKCEQSLAGIVALMNASPELWSEVKKMALEYAESGDRVESTIGALALHTAGLAHMSRAAFYEAEGQ